MAYAIPVNKIGKPVDRTEWGMTPQTYNAEYNHQTMKLLCRRQFLQCPVIQMTS